MTTRQLIVLLMTYPMDAEVGMASHENPNKADFQPLEMISADEDGEWLMLWPAKEEKEEAPTAAIKLPRCRQRRKAIS